MSESLSTWACYAGEDRPETPWLLHPCDVWVRNPHYDGPPAPHPEDEPYDAEDALELPEKDQPWTQTASALRSAWDTLDTSSWDDELPF